MECRLTGEKCSQPVVTPSGIIFDKPLIEKCLSEQPKCPVTGKDLNPSDLIEINTDISPVTPKSPSATSLSSLLKSFQNEWDSVMFELFNLKKQNESLKQELSNSVYQYDAACRVISKLLKEKEETQKALADTQKNMEVVMQKSNRTTTKRKSDAERNQENKKSKMSDNENIEKTEKLSGSLEEAVSRIAEFAKTLSFKRSKGRKEMRAKVLPKEELKKFKERRNSVKIPSEKGISALALMKTPEEKIITGAETGEIYFASFEKRDSEKDKKISPSSFHSSAVTNISVLTEDKFLSSYTDGKILLCGIENGPKIINNYDCHDKSVTSLSVQPLHEHFASCSTDRTWTFTDINERKILFKSPEQTSGCLSLSFHPDGLILGVGTEKSGLGIWDLNSCSKVASFEKHSAGIKTLSFSENGYYLASGDKDGVINIWDLRKSKLVSTIGSSAKESAKKSYSVNQVRFGPFGGYLAVCGENGIDLHAEKTWEVVKKFETKKELSQVVFADDFSFLAAGLKNEGEVLRFGREQ